MSSDEASNKGIPPVYTGERAVSATLTRDTDGYVFPLDRACTLIGRSDACDLVLGDPLVSRRHAEIVRQPFGYIIRDTGSRNGTVVNGRLLAAGETRPLRDNDMVQIGATSWHFHDPSATVRVPGLGRAAAAPLFLDDTKQEAYVHGQRLELAPKEFALLALLLERPGEMRDRSEIAQAVWPEYGGAVANYNIDVLISRLRQRLSAVAGPEAAAWLVTVKKRGYRLVAGWM